MNKHGTPHTNLELILASRSPRRARLLEQVGIPFRIVPPAVGEEKPEEDAMTAVLSRARAKVEAVASHFPDELILGVDTLVVHDGKALGKPADREAAIRTLLQLQNAWHEVFTGLVVRDGRRGQEEGVVMTRVRFAPLTPQKAEAYVDTGEPFDTAGSYGIQSLGAVLVERLDGDYYNVVGLPLQRLILMLERLGIEYTFGELRWRGG